MDKRKAVAGLPAILAAALLTAACSDALGPERNTPGAPLFDVAASSGLVLDVWNGTLGQSGIPEPCSAPCLIKGFNPTNPQLGDAVIATFFWVGQTNIIDSVTDHITNVDHTPVGNKYSLVRYVTGGGVSMATYVATNVQNFPGGSTDPNQILAVRANLRQAVTDGGVVISAYRGLPVTVGPSSSAQGSGTSLTPAAPGAISVRAGGVAYGVTMSGTLVGVDQPGAPFVPLTGMSDGFMNTDAEYAPLASAGTVNPQWSWGFSSDRPGTWLATAVALNPAATHLVFTVQPSNTLPLTTIRPAVQVAATDDLGNTVTTFTGSATIAIGRNGGLLLPGTLSGTKTVTFVNGVATFADLSIDQVGSGYTLRATASGLTGAESASFSIGAL
jgi:hypothetical protein